MLFFPISLFQVYFQNIFDHLAHVREWLKLLSPSQTAYRAHRVTTYLGGEDKIYFSWCPSWTSNQQRTTIAPYSWGLMIPMNEMQWIQSKCKIVVDTTGFVKHKDFHLICWHILQLFLRFLRHQWDIRVQNKDLNCVILWWLTPQDTP